VAFEVAARSRFRPNLKYTFRCMDHSPEFLELVKEAMANVREISVAETRERMKNQATLIDVREDNEFAAGHAAGAEHIGRGVIERDIVAKHPDKSEELILYCGGGYRSALAAVNLQKMGYTDVWSMAGGWSAWKDAGAPLEEDGNE
jgi:rhodanese-related sulfurtransferase